jgi:hypothetical protein
VQLRNRLEIPLKYFFDKFRKIIYTQHGKFFLGVGKICGILETFWGVRKFVGGKNFFDKFSQPWKKISGGIKV